MTRLLCGIFTTLFAGLMAGAYAAPIKAMRSYKYEHWALVSSIVGLVVVPWTIAILLCPNLSCALAQVEPSTYLKANACSLAWGAANILCCICLLRIGFSMTVGILTGVGLPIGMLVPLLIKGSGEFASADGIFSRSGLSIATISLVMVLAIALMARAGTEREKGGICLREKWQFKTGLAFAALAGILQVGLSFAFVYSQGPLTSALNANGIEDSGALAAVWAATLPGGALLNIAFPLFLIVRNRNAKGLLSTRDFALSVLMGVVFVSFVLFLGAGMKMLGALGASLGFGMYQGMQITAAQGVGVISGEWTGAVERAKTLMFVAILLILASVFAISFLK